MLYFEIIRYGLLSANSIIYIYISSQDIFAKYSQKHPRCRNNTTPRAVLLFYVDFILTSEIYIYIIDSAKTLKPNFNH